MALPAPWTVRWLKDVFLYGLDLTDDRNRPYPDALFVQAMAAGAAWGANHLDIDVFRRTITGERFDLNRAAAGGSRCRTTNTTAIAAPIAKLTREEVEVQPRSGAWMMA